MLKKISVDDLVVGMHLHAFCGSWMDHPFWRTKFVITDEKDIELVRNSIIREVWIDAEKGIDVPAGIKCVSTAAEEPPPTSPPIQEKTTLAEEAQRAFKICAKSKQAVASMFQEVRMGKAINTEDALPIVEEITSSISRNPGAIISLARLKTADDYTFMHSVAVCALMVALSKQLNLDEKTTREAGLAGLMHDLGKAMIPTEILNKPGKLTDEEFDIVKTHPAEGHKLLLEGKGAGEITLEVCLHHHEKMAGGGYPGNQQGDQISLYARMGAVCDVYDAITSNRPYKAGWDPAESIKRMAEWKGHFDPPIFQAFVKSLGIYPIGSFVRLGSGRLGVVIEQGAKSLLTPKVKVFFSAKSQLHIRPEIVDLAFIDKIVSREDPVKWGIPNIDQYWAGDAAPKT